MMRSWLPGRLPWHGRSSDSSPPVATLGGNPSSVCRPEKPRPGGAAAPDAGPRRRRPACCWPHWSCPSRASSPRTQLQAQTTASTGFEHGEPRDTQVTQLDRSTDRRNPSRRAPDTAVGKRRAAIYQNGWQGHLRIAPSETSGGGPDLSNSMSHADEVPRRRRRECARQVPSPRRPDTRPDGARSAQHHLPCRPTGPLTWRTFNRT